MWSEYLRMMLRRRQSDSSSSSPSFRCSTISVPRPVPEWVKFLRQFADPLIILLLFATVISLTAWLIEGAHGIPYETLTIVAIVIFNSLLGYLQERHAEEAVEALKAMAAPTARVLRDGEPCQIPAREVVPGDILLIEEGDTLPADARVIESIVLRVAEAALTGESSPASKNPEVIAAEAGIGDQENMVFSGTSVTTGRGSAVVVATGASSEIGRIAGSLQSTQEAPTPLQKELDRVGYFLGRLVITLAVIMGVPMYTNAAGIIPIVQALLAKGAALGTVLAFMMAVIALSLPEMIILRNVLKPRLIATFVAVVSGGILLVGYIFNAVL